MSLQSARYLNFVLDMVVRGLTVAASMALNYVAVRVATALSFGREGVLAQDAIALNLACVSFVSLWDSVRLRVPRALRVFLSVSLVSGLISYFASSLIFGYQALEVTKLESRDVQVWSNNIVLGSNASARYFAPNYTDLIPRDQPSTYAGAVAKTLSYLDTSHSHAMSSEPSFDTVAESNEDLLLRNITQVLQTETISTKLIDCRPIGPSDNATFDIFFAQGSVVGAVITVTDGPVIELIMQEPLSTPSELIFPVGEAAVPLDQAYTFVLQTAPTNPYAPSSLSKIAIALVDGNVCTNGQMQTPFGTITPFNQTVRGLQLTIAAIMCNLERTRSQYNQVTNERTTETYLSSAIIQTANNAFLYSPIGSPRGLNGVGSLLYQHVDGGNKWRIPQCNSSSPSAPWSVDNTALWARAVELVALYESSLLQSAEQLSQSTQTVQCRVSTIAYQLAILPAALLVFGLFLGALCCLLMYLLVVWSWIPHGYHPLDPLRIVDEIDRHNSVEERLPNNRPAELTPEELENTLGAKRLRRHEPSFRGE
ncbi:hypothetical protein FRC07_001378 [Ceratobasidium sp. 392]|nr:hypothetical protein FRC07_001378 [Ceratobasidium sp. 392]